jgi:hypothetical protein
MAAQRVASRCRLSRAPDIAPRRGKKVRDHFIVFAFLGIISSTPVDTVRVSLEAQSAKWFHWLLFASWAVAFGCLLEMGETFPAFIRWWRRKKRLPFKEEDPISWAIPASALGLLLIILGVVGEGIFEARVDTANTALQSHESQILSSAEAQAGEANEKAGAANKEAAQLRVDAAKLEEEVSEQGPRELLLYGKREETFLNSIRHFKGQKVQIRYCVFNRETRATAERLTALFTKAEWVVSPYSPDWGESNCLIDEPLASGIWVGTPNSAPTARTRERAKDLVQILNQVPLAAKLHSVRPETARSGPSRESIQGRYDPPDGIVVALLEHPLETDTPPSHGGGGIMF